MGSLEDFVARCGRGQRKLKKGFDRGIVSRSWSEPETLNGEQINAFCIILPNRGCSWDKCTMCGYNNECDSTVDSTRIFHSFDEAMTRYNGEEIIKIFNSGSFFNEGELSQETRHRILCNLNGKAKKVIVETRAEHTNKESLNAAKQDFPTLEVALGLESATDLVLEQCINKGMHFSDYERAARTIKDCGLLLKTYLLLKPPFLTESEAISDAVKSIEAAALLSDEISLNPVNVQAGTVVEYLWRRGHYRPPWLWSVTEALRLGKKRIPTHVRLMSSPTGGGTLRGAHNCGTCDGVILNAISRFSLSQDAALLENKCGCIERWKDSLELEMLAHTSANLERVNELMD